MGSGFISITVCSMIVIGNVQGTEENQNPCPETWIQATFVDMGCLLVNRTQTLTWMGRSSQVLPVAGGCLFG